jgi:hypothetical protein
VGPTRGAGGPKGPPVLMLKNALKTSNSKNNFEAMVNENTSTLDIAKGFNNFFTKIDPSLANKINPR